MHIAPDTAPAPAPAAFDEAGNQAGDEAGDEAGNAAGDADLTPLAAILATMRWAHDMAVACAPIAALAGTDAIEAAKAAIALRAFTLKAARAATPYVHARLKTAEPPDPNRMRTHEEWLAELERAAPERDQHRPTRQDDGAAAARPGAAEPGSIGAPRAPVASPAAAAAAPRADARGSGAPSPYDARTRRRKRDPVPVLAL